MQRSTEIEFKSLLSKEEYDRLYEKFKSGRLDIQTNHYFDTQRFSLKALDTSLRVRERNNLELTLKRKKGYAINEYSVPLTREDFEQLKKTGVVTFPEICDELTPLINNQRLYNFLSLKTKRIFLPYGNGVLFLDRCEYLGLVDYELEYEAKSYHQGKQEFINLITSLNIQYKKSDKKIKRAFNAYKRLH